MMNQPLPGFRLKVITVVLHHALVWITTELTLKFATVKLLARNPCSYKLYSGISTFYTNNTVLCNVFIKGFLIC